MLALLQDLVRHKAHANASLLRAVRDHEAAAHDTEIRTLLHHVILANRFWFSLMRGVSFQPEHESRVPDSLEEVAKLYRNTHAQELEWIASIQKADLMRSIETPFIPGQNFSVAQALLQVCLHSHGHRAQCATRLRQLGGIPPQMDFVMWLKDRPAPDWECWL
jgi:uncharacterized damage-inducible protein DinB